MVSRSPAPVLLLTAALTAGALMLSGCAYSRPNPTFPGVIPQGPGDTSFSRAGGPYSGVIYTNMPDQPPWRSAARSYLGAPAVNSYLWRAALDTVAAIPLISTDSFGGIIVTDWYTPAGITGERLKANIFVHDNDVGSSRVDLQACKLEYSIVSPK